MGDDVIDQLAHLLSKLPGLGKRSAKRAVLHLIKHKESLMMPLSSAITEAMATIKECSRCGNIDSQTPCHVCSNAKRDASVLCVVEEVADLWAFERSGMFRGLYHVLGGTLSALDGRGPDDLNIPILIERVTQGNISEVILATNATVEGQTTAHYIMERLAHADVTITQLAQGIPMGGELDYLDDGTLGAALQQRTNTRVQRADAHS